MTDSPLQVASPSELRDLLQCMVERELIGPAGGPEEEVLEGSVRAEEGRYGQVNYEYATSRSGSSVELGYGAWPAVISAALLYSKGCGPGGGIRTKIPRRSGQAVSRRSAGRDGWPRAGGAGCVQASWLHLPAAALVGADAAEAALVLEFGEVVFDGTAAEAEPGAEGGNSGLRIGPRQVQNFLGTFLDSFLGTRHCGVRGGR